MQDLFTGSSSTPLATHDANWLSAAGRNVADLVRVSNQARCTATYAIAAARYTGSNGNRSFVTVIGAANATTDNPEIGALARASATVGYAVHFGAPVGANFTELRLYYVTGTTLTLLAQPAVAIPWASNHDIDVVVSTPDAGVTINIKAYIDGSATATLDYNDTSGTRITAVGESGVYLRNRTELNAAIDAWSDSGAVGAAAHSIDGDVTLAINSSAAGMQYVPTGAYDVSGTLVNSSGAPLANLTNAAWQWFDAWGAAPTDTGVLTTDASGNFLVAVPISALVPPNTGYLAVEHAGQGLIGLYKLPVA